MHNTNRLVVVPEIKIYQMPELDKGTSDPLLADFHLSPFTPNFCKIFDGFEVDIRALFKDLACTINVRFCLSICAPFLVEFGKVNI